MRLRIETLHGCIAGLFLFLLIPSCRAQEVPGCTDPHASNFNPSANVNDGSCVYPMWVGEADLQYEIDERIHETSGLIHWEGMLWTHNDNTDLNLYKLSPLSGNAEEIIQLGGVTNTDWEELSQDETHLYIGDFGNNVAGVRTDLHVLKIAKQSLRTEAQEIDTIWFSYEDQTDFTPGHGNDTDYDCEAFLVGGDSLYLFTKRWISGGTSLYRLPKTKGTHVAEYLGTFEVPGLVTGATFHTEKRIVALCGYSSLLNPFVFLLYDFQGMDFFSGNKRPVAVNLSLHPVEGISTVDGGRYFLSNERFDRLGFVIPQALYEVNLSDILDGYLQVDSNGSSRDPEILVFPNPASFGWIRVRVPASFHDQPYDLLDLEGRVLFRGFLRSPVTEIQIPNQVSGTFVLRILSSGATSHLFTIQ